MGLGVDTTNGRFCFTLFRVPGRIANNAQIDSVRRGLLDPKLIEWLGGCDGNCAESVLSGLEAGRE